MKTYMGTLETLFTELQERECIAEFAGFLEIIRDCYNQFTDKTNQTIVQYTGTFTITKNKQEYYFASRGFRGRFGYLARVGRWEICGSPPHMVAETTSTINGVTETISIYPPRVEPNANLDETVRDIHDTKARDH